MKGKIKFLALTAALLLSSTASFAQYEDPETGVTYTAISGSKSGGEGYSYACDGKTDTKFGNSMYSTQYIVIQASKLVVCDGYTIITANDNAQYTGRNPKHWKVEGSKDNVNWTLIDEVTDDTVMQDENFTPFSFTCEPKGAYRYFKFTVLEAQGGSSVYMQFSEFHISGQPVNSVDVQSGYNADVVVEAVPSAAHLTLGIDNANTGFFSTTVDEIASVNDCLYNGIQSEMPIVSAETGANYVIDYASQQTLQLRNTSRDGKYAATHDATLEFKDEVTTSQIYVLCNAGNGPGNFNVVVNYADGTQSDAQAVNVPDWFDSSDYSSAVHQLQRVMPDGNDNNAVAIRFVDRAVTCDASKAVKSLTFTYADNSSASSIINIIGLSAGDNAIAVTSGTNADVIAEGYPFSDYVDAPLDQDGYVVYVSGVVIGSHEEVASSTTYNHGLADGGMITTKNGTVFIMDYAALNSLRLGGDVKEGEIAIDPIQASNIRVLSTCGNGATDVNVTVNYTDGTSTTKKITIPDWFLASSQPTCAVENLGRVYNGVFDDCENFFLFEDVIAVNPGKTVASVKFAKASNENGVPVIMGLAYDAPVKAEGVATSKYDGNEVAEGEYFLYNPTLDEWLGDNNRNSVYGWTSHAEVTTRGRQYGFIKNGETWQIDPHMGNNHSLISGGLWMDTNNAVTYWTLTPYVTEDGKVVYTIAADGKQLATNASGDMDEAQHYNEYWQLVTPKQRLAMETANATSENPADLSWAINGGDFPVADDFWNTEWTSSFDGGNNVNGGDGDSPYYKCNRARESWNSNSYNVSYTLTDLPNGVYQFTLQGYYRDGSIQDFGTKHTDGTEVLRAYYFANDEEAQLQSIIAGGADEKSDNRYYYNADGKWVPDGLQAASAIFFEGGYWNEPITFAVTDGTATLGIKKEGDSANGNWTVFDTFTLKYLGDAKYFYTSYAVTEDTSEPAVVCRALGKSDGATDASTVFVDKYNYNNVTITVTDANGNEAATVVDSDDNYKLVSAVYPYETTCDVTTLILDKTLADGDYTVTFPAGSLVMGEGADFEFNKTDIVRDMKVDTSKAGKLIRVSDVDGIATVEAAANGRVYNIQGVEVKSANQRGLYIVNGKKYIVK